MSRVRSPSPAPLTTAALRNSAETSARIGGARRCSTVQARAGPLCGRAASSRGVADPAGTHQTEHPHPRRCYCELEAQLTGRSRRSAKHFPIDAAVRSTTAQGLLRRNPSGATEQRVQRRQDHERKEVVGDDTADHDRRQRPLHLGADAGAQRHRQEPRARSSGSGAGAGAGDAVLRSRPQRQRPRRRSCGGSSRQARGRRATETPETATNPTPAEIVNGMPRSHSAPFKPDRACLGVESTRVRSQLTGAVTGVAPDGPQKGKRRTGNRLRSPDNAGLKSCPQPSRRIDSD